MTQLWFLLAAVLTVAATLLAVTRRQAVHALLYLIVSFLALAMVFSILGSSLAALLEIIVYAGAIMVLFLFVVMMLSAGRERTSQGAALLEPRAWLGPAILALLLLAEWIFVMFTHAANASFIPAAFSAKEIGIALFSEYLLAVELSSMLLLAALVGAFHLARKAAAKRDAGDAA